MAAPMRSGPVQEAGHRGPRVADNGCTGSISSSSSNSNNNNNAGGGGRSAVAISTSGHHLQERQQQQQQHSQEAALAGNNSGGNNCGLAAVTVTTHHQQQIGAVAVAVSGGGGGGNFEYDDNEWDIGIGDLIIDLDADIEKTTEKTIESTSMAANAAGAQATKAAAAKMAVEHSATVDKGLKMKIKRTKPGTKTSEAKHEIVKSNEQQNGSADLSELKNPSGGPGGVQLKHSTSAQSNNVNAGSGQTGAQTGASNGKRGSSGHRRDKARDKHATNNEKTTAQQQNANKVTCQTAPNQGAVLTDMNGLVRVGAVSGGPAQPGPQRPVFPANSGPGPPTQQQQQQQQQQCAVTPNAAPNVQVTGSTPGTVKNEGKVGVGTSNVIQSVPCSGSGDDRGNSPPPSKKIKTETKVETSDVCVGTSVGTITEPDCLGPCEPGTSVTLEGIVWHETESGVLVVNVTWRGKTYVGTLLDCTRHDWAPPRFCDSPTSDLDNRTPKGRETRSSVHSKLRNGGLKGRRGAANGPGPSCPSSPTPFVPPRSEPTSNKRKNRSEDENATSNANSSQTQNNNGSSQKEKKSKVVIVPPPTPTTVVVNNNSNPAAAASSPPPSPVLLECPEPNCSKKYKHINGLKYHQSHAHGNADEEDTKDVTSMSENDESNIEAPSPATPPVVKSPQEKGQDSPLPVGQSKREEDSNSGGANNISYIFKNSGNLLDVNNVSQPATPRSTPPSPASQENASGNTAQAPSAAQTVPSLTPETKSVVKPGVLRFNNQQEDFGVFGTSKNPASGAPPQVQSVRSHPLPSIEQPLPPSDPSPQSQPPFIQLQPQVATLPPQSQPQSFQTSHVVPPSSVPQLSAQLSPHPTNHHRPPSPKMASFKVKPTASLMPNEDVNMGSHNNNKSNKNQQCQQSLGLGKSQSFKKKNRKSPAGSPHPPQNDQPILFGVEQSGREEVQSPAYSDISDDGAPMEEIQADKGKNSGSGKKAEPGAQTLPHMSQYGMYPFYGQPQYLVPTNVQQQQQQQDQNKQKEQEKLMEKPPEKDGKKDAPNEYPPKVVQQQHYYPYGYMGGYPYNMDPTYAVPMVQEEKIKEERLKESPSPIEQQQTQQQQQQQQNMSKSLSNQIQKSKQEQQHSLKEKQAQQQQQQNDNHQILKESIEMKNQMNPYLYSRQPQQNQQMQSQQNPQQMPAAAHHNQREEDVRRFYVYEQRRKESQQQGNVDSHKGTPTKGNPPPQSPSSNMKSYKDPNMIKSEEKDSKKDMPVVIKQEGVKPTMETQGPPPPPTSQYAYIHHNYMQSPHYGALHFDPNHSVYRGLMVPGPYGTNPYLLNAQIPRYHAPEDLSRAQPPTKALDMLEHHAQYYSQHKIHELQERAIKSPTPNKNPSGGGNNSVSSPASTGGNPPPLPPNSGGGQQPPQMTASSPMSQQQQQQQQQQQGGGGGASSGGKQTPGSGGKESRSPPPQRHVHTHHHTHVGLSYPMYPAPYGAAVIASQQAAAVTVINPYPTK